MSKKDCLTHIIIKSNEKYDTEIYGFLNSLFEIDFYGHVSWNLYKNQAYPYIPV